MRRPAFLVAALAAVACSGAAEAATRTFPVPTFDRVTSSVPFDVHVHTGGAPAVRADGTPEALDRLRVEVRGGELVIGTVRSRSFLNWNAGGQHLLIDVSVPMVQAATLSGPGDLTVDRVRAPRFSATLSGPGNLGVGSLEARQVDVSLSGPGDVRLAGRTESANMMLSGPGNIRAQGLTARDALVHLSGPGDIAATVTSRVEGILSGPGNIVIQGGARCDVTRHGPGDVRCR